MSETGATYWSQTGTVGLPTVVPVTGVSGHLLLPATGAGMVCAPKPTPWGRPV